MRLSYIGPASNGRKQGPTCDHLGAFGRPNSTPAPLAKKRTKGSGKQRWTEVDGLPARCRKLTLEEFLKLIAIVDLTKSSSGIRNRSG